MIAWSVAAAAAWMALVTWCGLLGYPLHGAGSLDDQPLRFHLR